MCVYLFPSQAEICLMPGWTPSNITVPPQEGGHQGGGTERALLMGNLHSLNTKHVEEFSVQMDSSTGEKSRRKVNALMCAACG